MQRFKSMNQTKFDVMSTRQAKVRHSVSLGLADIAEKTVDGFNKQVKVRLFPTKQDYYYNCRVIPSKKQIKA
jgi:hypothetical protein